MSWLKNVGNFLEKLDDQAERVAEDRILAQSEHGVNGSAHGLPGVPEDVQLQSILAARGLASSGSQEEDEEPRDGKNTADEEVMKDESQNDEGSEKNDDNIGQSIAEPTDAVSRKDGRTADVSEAASVSDGADAEEAKEPDSSAPPLTEPQEADEKADEQPSEVHNMEASNVSPSPTIATDKAAEKPPPPSSPSSGLSPKSYAALREAQKEARTLRRHVVSLNKQLEHAETELQAQRGELERAADRLEKDRVRHKQDKEESKKLHAQELSRVQAQHEQTLADWKQRSEQQCEQLRQQLRDVEERRRLEGGDWNKEMHNAVQREQDMAQQLAVAQDEKEVALQQVSILQSQQEALGTRLESLNQTADNALERERDAERRLDEALNLHARQLAQRQAREAELERTVAELGSALVAARNKKETADKDAPETARGDSAAASLDQNFDVQGLVAQLDFEKQRCQTLQSELRQVSQERTEEITAHHSRQLQFDRRQAELSHTIARLETELQQHAGGKSTDSASLSENASHQQQQMREMSEELLRQREKLAHSTSEVSALKSRLKVAQERAQNAETALEAAESRNSSNRAFSDDGWSSSGDLEQAPMSGDGGMRRRGAGKRTTHRQHQGVESMRAALHVDSIFASSGSGGGGKAEQIGKALDGVDAFLVASGRFLRTNALARLLFIAYLLLLHVWTFILLILHAHGLEQVHGDFGAGQNAGHGPEALMMQQHQLPPPAAAEIPPAAHAETAGGQP